MVGNVVRGHMKRYIKTVCGRITADAKEYGAVLIILVIYTIAVNLMFHAFCPLIIFSGFPCPGCGITRATVCFLTGRWAQAWRLNPVVFPVVAAAFYFACGRYLLGRSARGIKVMIWTVFVLLIAVYAVRMYLYFPDRAPYIYTQDNVLSRLFPFYEQILHRMGIL